MSSKKSETETNKSNPKEHDNVFKWAIASFVDSFFDYFVKGIAVTNIEFIDKEFIKKYEALKESIKGDLFLIVTVEIDNKPWQIVVLIELKSKREHVHKKMREYMCYASLLREVPVWGMVFYTDDGHWRDAITDRFPFAYSKEDGLIEIPYDIIKLKEHKSADLTQQHSLLLKILALKADDSDCDREQLTREIYRAAAEQKESLTNDQKLMIERFVVTYANLPETTVDKIKKEANMTFVASTITEHILHQGELIERARSQEQIKREVEGRKQAEAKAERAEVERKRAEVERKRAEAKAKRSSLTNIEELFEEGIISAQTFEMKAAPLRKALAEQAGDGRAEG